MIRETVIITAATTIVIMITLKSCLYSHAYLNSLKDNSKLRMNKVQNKTNTVAEQKIKKVQLASSKQQFH